MELRARSCCVRPFRRDVNNTLATEALPVKEMINSVEMDGPIPLCFAKLGSRERGVERIAGRECEVSSELSLVPPLLTQ